jgi:hypothetical protein
LVASPNQARDQGRQPEETSRLVRVIAQTLRPNHLRLGVQEDPVVPTPDLVSKDTPPLESSAGYCTLEHDPSRDGITATTGQHHLNGEQPIRCAHPKGGVIDRQRPSVIAT